MSYIGKEPSVGNFVKLDAISVVNGQAGYTMQSSSVNFTPESANHMLVSLNGVIQAPISSFTVSGSTITFASALSTGDVIDFIMVYGNVLDIGTPSDDTISTAKLQNTSVTAGKLATDSVIEAKIQNDAVTRDKINAISTSSLPSFEAKGTSGVTEGYIQLNCAENSHGIKLKSPPHSAGASYTLTFPTTDGNANEFLQTNGSGVMTWAEAGGTFNKIATADHSSNATSFTLTDCFSSTYSLYKIYFYDITMSATNNELRVYFQNSSNADVDGWVATAVYGYISDSGGSAGTGGEAGGTQDYIRVGHSDFGASANEVSAVEMTIYQPYESTNTIVSYNCQLRADNTHFYSIYGGARLNVNTSLENIKFQSSAGANLTSYKTVIYGIKR
jgi:hypothetical protein|tara:strand:- start:380 stop:1543 length:1164 start_codon:yes stop_codon:yes gene_type:complete